jgi:hypothetical protein
MRAPAAQNGEILGNFPKLMIALFNYYASFLLTYGGF